MVVATCPRPLSASDLAEVMAKVMALVGTP
jgi:hypothetical protein